jgi:hypothetical protein
MAGKVFHGGSPTSLLTMQSGTLGKMTDDVPYRSGRQLGAMTAILRTHGPFLIRHQGPVTAHIALQISRNFQTYFYADTNITTNSSAIDSQTGNVITIAIGDTSPSFSSFPIQAGAAGVSVRDSRGNVRTYGQDGARLGAAFLRPVGGERLELLVWGSDSEGLAQAARLVPTVTGVGQPDFVVLGESAKWKGVEGALAMGFFDHTWAVTPSSMVS